MIISGDFTRGGYSDMTTHDDLEVVRLRNIYQSRVKDLTGKQAGQIHGAIDRWKRRVEVMYDIRLRGQVASRQYTDGYVIGWVFGVPK